MCLQIASTSSKSLFSLQEKVSFELTLFEDDVIANGSSNSIWYLFIYLFWGREGCWSGGDNNNISYY